MLYLTVVHFFCGDHAPRACPAEDGAHTGPSHSCLICIEGGQVRCSSEVSSVDP